MISYIVEEIMMALNSNELDMEMFNKFQAQTAVANKHMGFGEELIYGAVASVADLGTTVWNSLTPQKYEVSTYDLLNRVSDNALAVYNEHPDAVRTASLIGGAFTGGGLAIKGMGMLRAGVKGASWFTGAAETANLARISSIAENVGVASQEVNSIRTAMYGAMAANAVVDNIAMEAAVVMTMNAHPYMEDYMKDFGSNFLLWSTVGSGIGMGIGAIGVKAAIRNTLMPIESNMVRQVMTDFEPINPSMNLGAQLKVASQNIENWQSMLDRAKSATDPFVLNNYTKTVLEEMVIRGKATVNATLEEMVTPAMAKEISSYGDEFKSMFSNRIARNPGLLESDTAKFLTDEGVGALGYKFGSSSIMDTVGSFIKTTFSPKTGTLKKTTQEIAEITHLGDNAIYVTKDVAHELGSVADSGVKSLDEINSTFNNAGFTLHKQRMDAGDRLIEASTAKVELDYIQARKFVDALENQEQFNKFAMHPDDIPAMTAMYNRIVKSNLTAEQLGNINLTISKSEPSFKMIEQRTLVGGGFSPSYLRNIANINDNRGNYQLYDGVTREWKDTSISLTTRNFVTDWLGGGYTDLRNAALAKLNPNASINTNYEAVLALEELINARGSVAFREKMRSLADADGNVLMYRGLRRDPNGHHAIESFTLSPGKARAFTSGNATGTRLYKVNVDNIITTFEDFATTTAKDHSNMEILVLNKQTLDNAVIPAHDLTHAPSKFFSSEGELITAETEKALGTAERKVGVVELADAIHSAKLKLEKHLKQVGAFDETIAMRLGMSDEAYKNLGSGFNDIKYADDESIIAALMPEKRTVVYGTNIHKQLHTKIRTNLTAGNLDRMNTDLVQMEMKISNDDVVKELDYLFSSVDTRVAIDTMIKEIDSITSSGLLNSMFRSSNSTMEHFGTVGILASRMGKDITHVINKVTDAVTKPVSETMAKVLASDAKIIEMNIATNVNAGISGTRRYKDGKFLVPELDSTTGKMVEVPAKYQGKAFQIMDEDVKRLFEAKEVAGNTLYELNSIKNRVLGIKPLSNIGYWEPPFNPRGKEIAYVLDREGGTSIIYDKTPLGLLDKVEAFKKSSNYDATKTDIILKGENQKQWNAIHGRDDVLSMKMADVSMLHSGASRSAMISTNAVDAIEMMNAYDHHIRNAITNLVEINMSPVMSRLEMISQFSQRGFDKATEGVIGQGTKKPMDTGMIVRNTILGRPQITEHTSWANTQNGMQVYTDMALKKISEFTTPLLQTVSGKIRTEGDWNLVNQKLAAHGLTPFNAIEDFARFKGEGIALTESMTPRLITLTNATVATSLLKFLEFAQPFVNMISLPILTSGAMRRINQKEFMGATYNPNVKFNLMSTMYDGIRFMNSVDGVRFNSLAKERGIFINNVSEATDAISHARSLDPGIMSKVESIINSRFVDKQASFLSNYSEEMGRKLAFNTGIVMAKKAYPGLSDTGVMTYARAFMDEAIGNYTASQRPALFQGTFGVAMGLFQTYMLTLAQQMYRGIDRKEWVGLGKQMLTQSTIFGATSLPGFHVVSEQIGTHFSDNHIDLETGLLRAVPDDAAKMILYGLPSSFGPGITTRGDIQPRVPNPLQGLDSLAAYNIAKQSWEAADRIGSAAFNADGNTGRAVMEALSMQSVSRPIARWSELFTGTSLSGKGDIVAKDAELYTTTGIISRIMATRPLEEIMTREAKHLDSTYKAADRDRQSKLIGRLKTHIRQGDLDSEVIQNLQEQYMRTGSPTGWRSAVNEAMLQKNSSGSASVKDHLRPDAPYQQMIDDIDP